MLFSQRYGYKHVKDIFQIDAIDAELRNGLWNALKKRYWDLRSPGYTHRDLNNLFENVWDLFFKLPIDTMPPAWDDKYKYVRDYFFECPWYEVYDFIEFVSSHYQDSPYDNVNGTFRKSCNEILERENSAFRFVSSHITRITSKVEVMAIEQAVNQHKYTPVSKHLDRSLNLLADKRNPDYRNSIKESISAVESLSKIIVNDDKATFSQALERIEHKYDLHPALKSAFKKLYGYTSDSNGIRHALLDEDELKYEDALYMLVTCSAFTNYLIEKAKD